MKKIVLLNLVLAVLISCGQKKVEQVAISSDTTVISLPQVIDRTAEIFADSNFTFIALDSLNEDMLLAPADRKREYISSVKRFTKDHCRYFGIGCTNTFWDDHVFLVSKQRLIYGILPVIIHDSNDFSYYHSSLFTLDKDYKKVDSLLVSLQGFSRDGDEIDYSTITEVKSLFSSDSITTINYRYNKFDNDSIVAIDSTIVYHRIARDGHIKILEKQKLK